MIKWEKYNEEVVKAVHDDVYYHRDLYEGNHAKLFERAQKLIETGELTDKTYEKQGPGGDNVKIPYVVANISKLIAEVPAMLVSRSIGQVKSSIDSTELQNESINETTNDLIDGAQGAVNEEVVNAQGEIIKQIAKDSKLWHEHWKNIVQQQVDGGLVGVPWLDDRGLRIEFKSRDVYFEHEDGRGADLVYVRTIDEEEYFHRYREREEEEGLLTSHALYRINDGGDIEEEEIEHVLAMDLLGLNEMEKRYPGRNRRFISYWANKPTFMNPLGVSALRGQGGKQDEINWSLTRSSIIFERNGQPKMAVSSDVFEAAQQAAQARLGYGPDGSEMERLVKLDHRDFQVVTYDENGRAMELIQIDVSKIGDVTWVKDMMRMVLMETSTSQKAVDFFTNEGSSAQSGEAKYFDLLTSIYKAEQLQTEYVNFLKELFESCLWLANYDDPAVIVEQPEIELKDMIPVNRFELATENNTNYTAGTQSLETTVRRMNPHASEDWIQEELVRIEEGQATDDSASLAIGRQAMDYFTDNRDPITGEVKQNEGDE